MREKFENYEFYVKRRIEKICLKKSVFPERSIAFGYFKVKRFVLEKYRDEFDEESRLILRFV